MPTRPGTHKRPSIGKRPRQDEARGHAASRGYDYRWQKLRVHLLRRDKYQCQVCREAVGISGHVDHIVPLSQGGTNDWDNLQVLCQACHAVKTNKERAGG